MTQLSIPDLAGKVVLVTGGSTGIGAAAAAAFARNGAKVMVHYNESHEAAQGVVAAIAAAGGEAALVQGDVGLEGVTQADRGGDGRSLRPNRRARQQCRRHAGGASRCPISPTRTITA